MTHYLLSVHTAAGGEQRTPSSDEMARSTDQISSLEAEMRSANALVFSGRLDDPSAATVVRAMNGAVQTTDGPFIESKEAIGGFYIIESESHDAALEWASRTSAVIGMPIEIRPFMGARLG